MNDTEQLLFLAAVWTGIAALIARFVPRWPGRIAVFLVLVGVPFWELPYGLAHFQKLCRDDAKLKVTAKVTPQDSVCIEYFDEGLFSALAKAGFSRVELLEMSRNAEPYLKDSRLSLAERGKLRSNYCIAFESNVHVAWRIVRDDALVRRSSTGEVVGRQSSFRWAGLWWQHAARPLLGRGGVCDGEWTDLINSVRQGTDR